MSEWTRVGVSTGGTPAGLAPDEEIEFRLEGDETAYGCRAGQLYWGGGPGRVVAWRRLGVGDVNGTAAGTAARFNAGKAPLGLIPAGILAEYYRDWVALRGEESDAAAALALLGQFQMRIGSPGALMAALADLDGDGLLWEDCAAVFEYGLRKYSAWNWARGQAWSVPIASGIRHLVSILRGEQIDPESGLPHRGHVACNIVMLWWFSQHFQALDDRPALPLAREAAAA